MQQRITSAPAKPIDVTATDGKRGKNQIADDPYSCIYCLTKTTIDLPDEILVRAKVFAAEQRTTLRDLVVRGLKAVTETPGLDDGKRRKAAIRYWLGRMQASNTEPMVPLQREDIYER